MSRLYHIFQQTSIGTDKVLPLERKFSLFEETYHTLLLTSWSVRYIIEFNLHAARALVCHSSGARIMLGFDIALLSG